MALRGMLPRPETRDPFAAFNFLVEIEGVITGGFSEVTGLSAQVESFDYREGGVNEYVHKIPGPATYPSPLTLKRGMSISDALWRWHEEARLGRVHRRSAVVMLLDGKRNPVWIWAFRDAYPVRWSGPELRAGTSAVAIEALELAHRGLVPLISGPVG
jgi:phage tail-like protein